MIYKIMKYINGDFYNRFWKINISHIKFVLLQNEK